MIPVLYISAAKKLISKYLWHIIAAVVVLVLLYTGYSMWRKSIYDEGFAAADKVWVDKYNKEIGTRNKRIAALEKSSKEEADEHKKAKAELEKKLTAALKRTPTIVTHDSKGQVFKCEGKEVVPYLGPDFTDAWNRLNEEGAMK